MNETGIEAPVRVLFVDDEEYILRAIRRLFMEEKYEILTANSGEDALKLLKDSQNIGLIVSDQRMPGIQGVDLLKQASEISPDTLRIVLTGYTDISAAIDAINKGGAYQYVTKPWKDNELIQIVRDAVHRYSLIRENRRLTKIVKRQNEELKQWNDQLQERLQEQMIEIQKSQKQLFQAQKMEAVGRLTGGIAHDFNNLLTIIKGYSQLTLIGLKESNSLKDNIREIHKASERATDLTRQLLAFSRNQMMEMKVLDLNTLLQNLNNMLCRAIGEDIELVWVLVDDLGRVKTDPGQIEQVIMNLIVNARDAMPSGGKITIETANVKLDELYAGSHIEVAPGYYVELSVSDTGIGMSPEVKDHIFEPFFTTKEKDKGTGLGLSVVHGIVKQSGGNILVYSEPGQGTTFKIYLPRVDEPLEELKEKAEMMDVPSGSETVLVVEDDDQLRKLVVQVLQTQGYRAFEASCGEDALMLCKEGKESIHLLLTDVVMPRMGGVQLVERCREMGRDFKVLYMSGYAESMMIHPGGLIRRMNYIRKPFTVYRLAKKVREVLDQDLKLGG